MIFYSFFRQSVYHVFVNWIEPKTTSKEEEEIAARLPQMHVSSLWVYNLISYMMGTYFQDFENRIFRGKFILNKKEIKGQLKIIA
jgi:hypothetical protein